MWCALEKLDNNEGGAQRRLQRRSEGDGNNINISDRNMSVKDATKG